MRIKKYLTKMETTALFWIPLFLLDQDRIENNQAKFYKSLLNRFQRY